MRSEFEKDFQACLVEEPSFIRSNGLEWKDYPNDCSGLVVPHIVLQLEKHCKNVATRAVLHILIFRACTSPLKELTRGESCKWVGMPRKLWPPCVPSVCQSILVMCQKFLENYMSYSWFFHSEGKICKMAKIFENQWIRRGPQEIFDFCHIIQ